MDFIGLLPWLCLALVYALAAVALQRLFLKFIEPLRQRARSTAGQT